MTTDGSQATKRFILDEGCCLVACEDAQTWAEWMGNPDHVQLLHGRVPGVNRAVRTVFTGENVGDDEFPIYFETFIEPVAVRINVVRECEPPLIYARTSTWADALAAHDKAIGYARRMFQ